MIDLQVKRSVRHEGPISNPFDQDPAIIAKLVQETMGWKSYDVTTLAHTRNFKNGAEFDETCRYTETDDGRRAQEHVQVQGNGPSIRLDDFCDGKRSARVRFHEVNGASHQELVTIKRTFATEADVGIVERPVPFFYNDFGLVPLAEALPKATSFGTRHVLDRPCLGLLFPEGKSYKGQQQIYFLDEEFGVVLRVESHWVGHVEKGRPVWVWEAKTLDEVQGRHLPLQSTFTHFQGKRGEPATTNVEMTIAYTAKDVSFDRNHFASDFWFKMDPGVPVNDLVAKKSYDAPGVRREVEVKADTATPIQVPTAPPASDWSASMIALGLGAALLVTGLIVWMRQRA